MRSLDKGCRANGLEQQGLANGAQITVRGREQTAGPSTAPLAMRTVRASAQDDKFSDGEEILYPAILFLRQEGFGADAVDLAFVSTSWAMLTSQTTGRREQG